MSAALNLKRQLGRYREKLANLSRRNRELYYRESKGTSLSLSKLPIANSMLNEDCQKAFSGLTFSSDAFAQWLNGADLDLHEFLLLDHYQDKHTVQKISNRLDRIRLADDKYQREFGISGAWVLGPFLCWRNSINSPKEDILITPLFKVPVDLYKNKRKRLILKGEVESVTLNPSFRIAIKEAYGIEFPEELSFGSPTEAIETISSALQSAQKKVVFLKSNLLPKIPPRFKYIRDESDTIIERVPIKIEEVLSPQELEIYNQTTESEFILLDLVYLDQLNASRAVLINDYDGIIRNGLEHPILTEMFNGVSKNFDPPVDRSKLRELDSYREKSNHFVVDIDSTQHRALDQATKSKAIVIQGPPGSGKSQTIVNLIADYLAKGKKVLFVSEKRPALDVVFNRMKGANIENQAVLIHSSDLNKAGLYKSFLELANAVPSEEDEKAWLEVSENLDLVKAEINSYADTLQETHKKSGLKIQELIFLNASVNQEIYSPSIAQQVSDLDFTKLEKLAGYLKEIQDLLSKCEDFKNSPWIFKRDNILATADLKYSLDGLLASVRRARAIIETAIEKANGFNFLKLPLTINSLESLALPMIPLGVDLIKGLFRSTTLNEAEMFELEKNLKVYLKDIEENKTCSATIVDGLDTQTAAEMAEYYRIPRNFFDWFSSSFWAYRKIRKKHCPQWDGTTRQLKAYVNFNTAVLNLKACCQNLNDESSFELSHDQLYEFGRKQLEALQALQKLFCSIKSLVTPEVLANCFKSTTTLSEAISIIEDLAKIKVVLKAEKNILSEVESKLRQYLTNVQNFDNLDSFEQWVQSLIERLDDLKILDEVDITISKVESQLGIIDFRAKIVTHFFSLKSCWEETLLSSTLRLWHDEAIQSFPALRSYDRKKINRTQQEFLKSVEDHKLNSRLAIVQAFATRWHTPEADKSGLGLLAKESSKLRRVLSPREIMEKGALKTMLQLKPCWLMSPLSISQLLPLDSGLFDVIIFDEASQVTVEDAIPSIFRASTMIVVGDDKQMPPTAFFSSESTDDEEEDEETASSVLDLASQVYPSVLLEWHYRSRAEALIAFSNRAFYGGRLIAAPNPQTLISSGAIHFHRIQEGYFNSRDGNTIEADAVINNLIEQLKNNPHQSYGIIAMGVSQATALQDSLEQRMNADRTIGELIEKAMQYKEGEADAGLFIKNLENVQGDERDVILLSVGYAPQSKDKNLRLGFGPLSKKGGGRRLNVAVTRAKSKMHIFCSFNPGEIPTGEDNFSKNPDLCCFGRYLKYTEAVSNGSAEMASGILNTFPMSGVVTSRKSSRFANDVRLRLEELGYEISSEIGSSGFYIDLAVHHPVVTSNFAVGIECDGAIFHSTPYARDRDKIRQELLESRGWKILRVWSQDWSNDWRSEVSRLDQSIKQILNESDALQFRKASG